MFWGARDALMGFRMNFDIWLGLKFQKMSRKCEKSCNSHNFVNS